ncbi:MAG TPA: hypothetical protein VJ982_00915 [Gemmatimonadota bacterium]|nr:hypothetical protein [Gemmatimonadota bacterium]
MNDDHDPTWAPLDPSRDPERWEAMVRGIVERAAPILAGYAERGPAELLATWLRPTLAAAAVVSALALGALLAGSREPETGATATIGLGDALSYPAPVTTWVSTGQTPTIEELVVAMEERNR